MKTLMWEPNVGHVSDTTDKVFCFDGNLEQAVKKAHEVNAFPNNETIQDIMDQIDYRWIQYIVVNDNVVDIP